MTDGGMKMENFEMRHRHLNVLSIICLALLAGCAAPPPQSAVDGRPSTATDGAEAPPPAGAPAAPMPPPETSPPPPPVPAPEKAAAPPPAAPAPEEVPAGPPTATAPETSAAPPPPPPPEARPSPAQAAPPPATPRPEKGAIPPPPAEKPPVARGEAPFVLELAMTSGGLKDEVPVDLADPKVESEVGKEASIGDTRFSLIRFSPSLGIEERIVACGKGESGPPALRLVIETGGQSSEAWLVAGSRLLGRSAARSALVEYLPAPSPEEFRAREALQRKLLDPTPKVLIELKKDGRRITIPGAAGKEARLEDPPYRVEVLKVFNCFALDPKTNEAIDQDPRPLNPAAQVRITRGEASRTTWLFSQLPEFSRGAEDEDAALRFLWPIEGHPHQGANFSRAEIVVFDSGSGVLKTLVGVGGQVVLAELPVGKAVSVLDFTITAAERIPSARISQTVKPVPGGSAALLLAWDGVTGKEERWIPVGATEELRSGPAIFSARLLARTKGPHGMGSMPPAPPPEGPPRPLPAGHPKVAPQDLPAGHPRVPGSLPAGHPPVPDPGDPAAPPPAK